MTFAIPPPHPCLHFLCKCEWSFLWILPKLLAFPPFGFSVTTDPHFCSPKNQVTPPKILPPGDLSHRRIAHVQHIKILSWLRGFRVKIANFSRLPRGDFSGKKTKSNIEKWPESLGVMLEFWYIERRLSTYFLDNVNQRNNKIGRHSWT